MDRIRSRPFATLLAVISAILIVVGRLNSGTDWGTPVFIAGIALLVVAAILVSLKRG
jgi:hypothetical protein